MSLRHNSICDGSSHCWPLNIQISFSSKRARTVYGATRPMGSNTEDTKLRTDRCVTESVSSRLTPLLTTNVSVTWSHLRPRTCDAVSGFFAAVVNSLLLFALVIGGFSFKDKLGTLLINFIRLNPPNLSSSTKLRLTLKRFLDFLQTQGSHPSKSCLARRERLRGNDLGGRRLFGEEHS